MLNFKKIKKHSYKLLLIIVLIVPLLDLLNSGFPLTHDGLDHLARIVSFNQNLLEGNIIPRWAGFLNWGYGHPIIMFLYPLPSYSISLIHIFGFSIEDSTKIFFGFSFITSGIAMYLFIKNLINEKSAIVGALLYTIAPYRFVDLYVRGALGEHTSFVFPPLIGYFILKIKKDTSYFNFAGLSLSIAGLILSHNAISLMFMPLVMLFIFHLVHIEKKERVRLLLRIGLAIGFGFGLSAFFWLPAFLEGKYTLRDIVIGEEYKNSFVAIKSLFFGTWSYGGTGKFTTQLGIIQWVGIIGGLVTYFTSKDRNTKRIILSCLTIFFLSLFIMTEYSGFIWEYMSILAKFQFPWRFLTLSVFTAAVIGSYAFNSLRINKNILILLILIALLSSNFTYWKASSYAQLGDKFFQKNYPGTTDTGESTPRWSVRFMEKSYDTPIEVLEGKATITNVQRKQTHHIYAVNAGEDSKLMENTLYFPGWKILVDNSQTQIEFQDRKHHGLMIFQVTKGLHKVDVIFTDTKIRVISSIISFSSVILLLLLGILGKGKLWRRYRLF